MTKEFIQTKELVSRIATKAESTKTEAKKHLDATIDVVKEALEAGENVRVKGLVDFTTTAVEAKEARNPKTGETVQVEAHNKRKATISGAIKDDRVKA